MATVRGTFDLNSRPASSALRDLRTEGVETDTVFKSLGQTLDGIGTTKQREQVRLYREGIKKLGTQWEKTATKADLSWTKMEKKTLDSVTIQSGAIDSLQGKVDELGRSSPTISVNTRGISESLAEVELLHKRLNALDRMRPTPSVGVGGIGRAAASGGGGGGGFFGRGLKIPFAGSIPLPLIAAGLGAAPPLLGGAGALLGSAGSAALGAGALGLGGLGPLAAGIGSIATVAIPAVKGLKEGYKALQAYNKAVATNGKNSTQAHTALEKLNASLQSAPAGTGALINQEQRFSSRIQGLTKPGQSSFIGSLSNLLGAGNQLAPQLAGIANPLAAAGQTQSGRLSNFLTGSSTRSFLNASGNTAISVLPDVESTFQHVMSTLMNISRAAMPFFRQSVSWLETWTKGWATSTENIGKTRTTIGGMVSNLKSWGRLTGATFDLMKDLFSSGTKSGQSLVDDLTAQLKVWDTWIKRNPAQVRSFFKDSVESTEKIAAALGKVTGLIWKLGQMLTPLLTQLSQFVSFAGSMGLLEPGMLPLLLAGGSGIRNLVGSARGRILGAPAGVAGGGVGETALIAGSVGGAGGRASMGSLFSRGRARLGTLGRVPATAGMLGSADMEAMGLPATRFSTGAAAAEIGGGLRTAGGTFLRGAGSRFLPIAALMGGLSAASFPGNFGNRLQAGLSGITAGLVEMPKTGAEKEDEGTRHAQIVANAYAEKYGSNITGLGSQATAIRRKRHRLLTPQDKGGLSGFLTSNIITGDRQQEVTEESRKEAEALLKQLEQVRSVKKSAQVERGASLGGQFAQSFNIRRKSEGGVAGLEDITGPILGKIKNLGPAGGKALAANVLEWVRTAKQQNPKLKKQYEELVQSITQSFSGMGHRIKVINGEIYDGSQQEWGRIQGAMTGPIEQAREEMEKEFTAIQERAVNVLRGMGYSPSQAKNLVQSQEQGHPTKALAAENVSQHHHGQQVISPNNIQRQAPGGARGLRIPGYGNTDHIPIGGHTGIGAPGELIVNPHTEGRANGLLRYFGTTLEQMQKGEKYRASTPVGQMYQRPGDRGFARGGRMGGGGGIESVGRYATNFGLHAGEGPGFGGATPGVHVGDSLHYQGLAYDVSGAPSLMYKFRRAAEQRYLGHGLNELFYDPYPYYIDEGHRHDGSIGGHSDHVHIGFFPGGPTGVGSTAVRGLMGKVGGGFKSLKAKQMRTGGAPGAMAQAGANAYAKGMNQRLRKLTDMSARGVKGLGGHYPSGGTSRRAVEAAIARTLFGHGANKVGAAGIIGNAWRESGMDPSAEGTGGGGLWGFTSGAISLANLKKAGGKNWANPVFQTLFMLSHGGQGLIPRLNASGSPEAAAALFMDEWERPGIPAQSDREEGARVAFGQGFNRGGRVGARFGGWHARGGVGTVSRPTLFGAGERGKEDVEIRPHKPMRKLASASGRRRGAGAEVKVIFNGPVHVRGDSDIEAIADRVGRKLLEAMEEDDGVDQTEVLR